MTNEFGALIRMQGVPAKITIKTLDDGPNKGEEIVMIECPHRSQTDEGDDGRVLPEPGASIIKSLLNGSRTVHKDLTLTEAFSLMEDL